MLFELALLSVAIPAGYWGAVYLRRRPFGTATFGVMLLATALLAVVAVAARRAGSDVDWLGAVALGAGAMLLVVGPLLRAAARWAVQAERLGLATVLVELRDLVQPGTGGREEKVLVRSLREVRAGRVDHAVAALVAVRPHASPPGRRQIDERIALLYLSAFRQRDAIDHVERTLLVTPPPAGDPDHRMAGLPMSAGLYAELVGAYGRVGDLDRAAAIADDLDRRAAGAPELVFLLHRVRLVLLAYAGEVAAVERLVAPVAAAHMTLAARTYWRAVARERAGDRDGARRFYEEALARARREPRAADVVRRALAELDTAPVAAPSPEVAAVVARLAAGELAMPTRSAPRRRWVTGSLIAVNLGAAAAIAAVFGSPGDIGALVRAGASLHAAVAAGEWWRLPVSAFLHVGAIHLAVNVVALWVLGRIAEPMFGSLRLLAIYLAAGIGGAVVSHAAMSGGMSAGASGAIFGLLGALLVELVLHRRHHVGAWRRGLVPALAVTTAANLAVGFLFDIIDNGAHLGGLVVGVVAAALLSPRAPWRRAGAALAAIVAAAGVAVTAGGAVMAVVTDYDDTLARAPRHRVAEGGLVAEVPVAWRADQGALTDGDGVVVLVLAARGGQVAERWPAWVAEASTLLRDQGFEEIERAPDERITVPAGWTSLELVAVVRDALGSEQRQRIVAFAAPTAGGVALGALFVPEVLAESGARELTRIVSSVRPAP
jgi:membrane associated rhomboid family serine protease